MSTKPVRIANSTALVSDVTQRMTKTTSIQSFSPNKIHLQLYIFSEALCSFLTILFNDRHDTSMCNGASLNLFMLYLP